MIVFQNKHTQQSRFKTYLQSLLEVDIPEGSGDSELSHDSAVDHEASRVPDALSLVLSSWLVVLGQAHRREVAVV